MNRSHVISAIALASVAFLATSSDAFALSCSPVSITAPGRPATAPVVCDAPVIVRMTSSPSHGRAEVRGDASRGHFVEYTPSGSYEGQDSFTLVANDGQQDSAPIPGSVTVQIDQDQDGVTRPGDCNDVNPAIRPNAPEIPGNAEDENCDGIPRPRVAARVTALWSVFGGQGTLVRRLTVTRLVAAARTELRCRGRGCAFRVKRLAAPPGGRLQLAKYFKKRKLPPGARLEVRVSVPNQIGLVKRYTIRRYPALPKTSTLCLTPGASSPKSGC